MLKILFATRARKITFGNSGSSCRPYRENMEILSYHPNVEMLAVFNSLGVTMAQFAAIESSKRIILSAINILPY